MLDALSIQPFLKELDYKATRVLIEGSDAVERFYAVNVVSVGS